MLICILVRTVSEYAKEGKITSYKSLSNTTLMVFDVSNCFCAVQGHVALQIIKALLVLPFPRQHKNSRGSLSEMCLPASASLRLTLSSYSFFSFFLFCCGKNCNTLVSLLSWHGASTPSTKHADHVTCYLGRAHLITYRHVLSLRHP